MLKPHSKLLPQAKASMVSSGRLIFEIDGTKVQRKRCKIRNNIKTFIISSSLKNEFKFNLNDMKFNDIGNIKGGRHYKDLIKIIYLQILSYNNDINLEKLLKNVYKKNK